MLNQVNLDQILEDALEMANDLLKGLRQSGYVVEDVGDLLSSASQAFAQYLINDATPYPTEKRQKTLRWSQESALALIEGFVQNKTATSKSSNAAKILDEQLSNLGNWKKFANDIVSGAEGRLKMLDVLENKIISQDQPSTKPKVKP